MKRAATIRDLAWFRENVPCLTACPVRTDCGRYVQLVAEGRFEEAYLIARAPNPLASVCGRVCAAPCEDACRRGNIDKPVSIRAIKRFVCDQYGPESHRPTTEQALFRGWHGEGSRTIWHLPEAAAVSRRSLERVAVVGSGPAGLACAHDLALLGYRVTVFEAADSPGGMLRFGVPAYRLPREVIAVAVATLLHLGVEFRFNTPLNRDLGLRQLRADGYRAIFLGVGAQSGRDLPIEGRDLDGVFRAVDYLLNVNSGYRVELGDRVVVIGGGSVALDAARTALRGDEAREPMPAERDDQSMTAAVDAARHAVRAGAREVHVVSLESEAELPAARTEQGREEMEEARREGIIFHYSRGPRRLIGEGGRVRGIETVTCSRVFDDQGRFDPQFAEGTESVLDADGVILAIGQAVDLSFLRPEDGLEINRGGTIKIDLATMATSVAGVFAGGDAAVGPRIIIEAEAHGKQAALSIDRYLAEVRKSERPEVRTSESPNVPPPLGGYQAELRRGSPKPKGEGGRESAEPARRTPNVALRVRIDEIPTREYATIADYDALSRRAPPTIETGRRVGLAEVEQRYDETTAVEQATRCLQCHVHPIYDADLCVVCGRCVDICPHRCLQFVPRSSLALDARDESIVTSRLETDRRPGEPVALLKDEERCIRCGLCAIRCPTGAFTMERFSFEEVRV